MTAIVSGGVDVVRRIAGHGRGGAGDGQLGILAREDVLRRAKAHGPIAHAEAHESREVAADRGPWLPADDGDHAGQSEISAPAYDLGESPAWSLPRDLHLDEDLVRTEGGGEETLEEFGGKDGARTFPALKNEARVEGDEGSRQLGGGIRVGEAAAQRAAMPDRRVAYVTRGLREERSALGHERRRHELGMAHEGADGETTGGIPGDAIETGHAIQVHEDGGAQQTQVEHRHQALSAREDLDVSVAGVQELHGVRESVRLRVPERGRLQEGAGESPATRS